MAILDALAIRNIQRCSISAFFQILRRSLEDDSKLVELGHLDSEQLTCSATNKHLCGVGLVRLKGVHIVYFAKGQGGSEVRNYGCDV